MSTRGMVTCPHLLASQAGVDVLRAGGSAVDATIATSAALAVLYPHMTGLGGDAFWLIYDAKTGRVRHLDGGGRAAANASIDWFARRGYTEVPFRGILPATLTTPGAVSSWVEAHREYGRLPLKRNLGERTVDLRRFQSFAQQRNQRGKILFRREFVFQCGQVAGIQGVLTQARRKGHDINAVPAHTAGDGRAKAGKDSQQRGLSGAIRAGNEQRGSGFDTEGKRRKEAGGASLRGQVNCFEHGRGNHPPL